MKGLFKLLVLISLCILFSVTNTLSQNVDVKQSKASLVLSKDYWVALNSAKEETKNENRENLKLCLQSQFFEVKTICVRSIVNLEGENILEKLVSMLFSNQIPQRSTERNLQRKEFNFVLIESIEKITGLKLLVTEEINVKEINRILKESRKWLASRKGIKFDENQFDEVTASDELLGYP